VTNDNQQLIPVESRDLIRQSMEWCTSITEIRIGDEQEYVKACETTRKVQGLLRDIDEDRRKNVDPINATLKEIHAQYRPVVDALENLKTHLRISTSNYERDQERKRQEAQRAADEKAKKDRDDLARLAAKENKKAEKAEAAGNLTGAEDHRDQAKTFSQLATSVEAPPPPPPPPRIEGKTTRDKWEARVIDPRSFIKWCLTEDKLHFLDIDISALNKIAGATKGRDKIPGVLFENNPVPVYRR